MRQNADAAASPMASHRFTQDRRLRRRAEFQRVFDAGTRAHGRFVTVLATANGTGTVRLGLVASRKLGDAVRRNRAKRLIREIFRRTEPLPGGKGIDVVVIPRRELFDAGFSSIENDFRTALRRCAARLPNHART